MLRRCVRKGRDILDQGDDRKVSWAANQCVRDLTPYVPDTTTLRQRPMRSSSQAVALTRSLRKSGRKGLVNLSLISHKRNSDILAYKSAQHLAKIEKSSNAHIESSQTFFNAKGGVSGGTIASFKALSETDPYRVKRGMGEYALVTTGGMHYSPPQLRRPSRMIFIMFHLTASRGVSSIGLRPYYSSPFIPAHGSFFVMGPVNSAVVRRSWALFRAQQQLAPDAETVSYGDQFTYSESQVFDKRGGLGSRVAAWVIGVLLTLGLAAIMKSRIVGARERDVKWWLTRGF